MTPLPTTTRLWKGAASAGLLLAVVTGCQPPPPTAPAPAGGLTAVPADANNAAQQPPEANPATAAAPPAPTQSAQPASTPPATTQSPPVHRTANLASPPPAEALPDDPLELARLAVEAHAEKVRLISTVHDLETAKAVSGTFPAVDTRHRLLEEKLGSRLLSDEVKRQLDEQFKARRDELQKDYAREYVRVAFIPGAWEHMHPELTPFADMTVIGPDAASLEREAGRMLTESIRLMQQAGDVEKALELSPRYRVATCRLGPVLGRLNVASGGSGIREIQPPQVTALRRRREQEERRFLSLPGVYHALRYGERKPQVGGGPVIAANPAAAQTDQIVADLRSQDRTRIINALNRLPHTSPDPAHAVIAAEVLPLLEFEPVRGSAAETIKRGWFSPSQIPEICSAISKLEDRGFRYMLAEGIARTPDLDADNIAFLATLFDEDPGRAVSVLRIVGPASETVAHQYALSPKVDVRKCVCELLKDIGSEASLSVLQKLTQDTDRGVSAKAQEAIREIGKPLNQRPHLRDRR